MNSYEKKKITIEIYDRMTEVFRTLARDLATEPAAFISPDANYKISDDAKKLAKEISNLIRSEISDRMFEIYKLK